MASTPLDETSLPAFLAAFYERARRDPLVGPVFARAIADDAWPRHMATIEAFWSSVLFRSGRYKGNPFGKHLALGALRPDHFARWLDLFREIAEARFAPADAATLSARAEQIGASLQAGLLFHPDRLAPATPPAGGAETPSAAMPERTR